MYEDPHGGPDIRGYAVELRATAFASRFRAEFSNEVTRLLKLGITFSASRLGAAAHASSILSEGRRPACGACRQTE